MLGMCEGDVGSLQRKGERRGWKKDGGGHRVSQDI